MSKIYQPQPILQKIVNGVVYEVAVLDGEEFFVYRNNDEMLKTKDNYEALKVFVALVENFYKKIEWPWSQSLEDQEWFDEECFMDGDDCIIPSDRYMKWKLNQQ